MTLYLIGLGLSAKSLSLEALEYLKKAEKIYLEKYTVDFPYKKEEIEKIIRKKIEFLEREQVENEKIVDESRKKDVVLFVYGSPLIATTHISLILKCKKEKIKFKVLHNASIIDAISETGLQIYKLGKTASMPKWSERDKPESFVKIIQENLKIKAHTLILVDIGLDFQTALQQLVNTTEKIKLDKIVVCSKLGTEEREIFYDKAEKLKQGQVKSPFCFIIPSKLHFIEEEALKVLSN